MAEAARRRPGPAPSLSRDEVISAALAVMSEDCLSAVSFRSVSARLGVNPMALYTYVRDKDELLAGMYDRVSAAIALDPAATAPVVDQLVDYYVTARDVLLRNVELYRLVRRPDLPGMDYRTAEQLCALLSRLGLSPAGIASMQATLLQFTMGNALYTASLTVAGGEESTEGAWAAQVADLDPEDYPHLRASAAAMVAFDAEREFVAALRAILHAAEERAT